MERQWDAWAAAVLADVMLSIYPERDESLPRQDGNLAAVLSGQWDARCGKDRCGHIGRVRPSGIQGGPDATVFYLLDQTFNTASTKNKRGMDPATLAENILTFPANRPFKNYEVHYVYS